jgi:hypothetical protein
MLAKRINLTKSEYFQHILCFYPASLFDSCCMLQSTNKLEFAKAVAKACNLEERSIPLLKGIRYLIDGVALPHRIPWTKNDESSKSLTIMLLT